MTKPHLDLTQTHGQRRYGDITAFFSWHGDKREPCLAMLPTKLIGTDGVRAIKVCIVPMSSAWRWDEHTGDGRHAAFTSAQFAISMGFTPDVPRCVAITNIVRDCLGDLLTMPPKPRDLVTVADAIRIDADGREHHSEIKDDAS